MKYPLNPSSRFIAYHGNYGGWGNRGGDPIDELDKACFDHDCEYDRSYKRSLPGRKARANADRKFIVRVRLIAADRQHPITLRLKAFAAVLYFQTRLLTTAIRWRVR